MISDDDIMTALTAFVFAVIPGLAIAGADPRRNMRQGQQNDVPMPPGPNWVLLTPGDRSALATTVRDYTPPVLPIPAAGVRDTSRSTQAGFNFNFYGPDATEYSQTFVMLFRDLYGCDFLRPYGLQPLWCDDGRQMPLIDSEKQFEKRWTIRAVVQINPTVSTSQQFADTLDVTLIEADQ